MAGADLPRPTASGEDGPALLRFVAGVQRRVLADAALRGAAAGLALALVAVLLWWVLRGYGGAEFRVPAALLAVVMALAGAGIGLRQAAGRRRAWRQALALAEASLPGSRNLLITAVELAEGRQRDDAVSRAILHDADALAAGASPRRIRPLHGGALALSVLGAAWALTLAAFTSHPAALPQLLPPGVESPRVLGVEVEIIPPPWIGGDTVRLRDPRRVEALAGSRLRLTVRAAAGAVVLESVAGTVPLEPAGSRTFTAEYRVEGDDFVALEPRASSAGGTGDGTGQGTTGARWMFGVSALRDQAPRVRVVAPGRDLLLPSPDGVVELEIEAEDDHALASLVLRYTRVTGFGEQHTFIDGEVPLEVERVSGARWQARARWPLAPLELERGDMVVYRAVATDRNPGGGPGESDTYMVEIGNANVAAAGGFSVEEDPDRYALSQQMVIVLTERLMARRGSLDGGEFRAEARTLSAAQRRVRAEFVFMLGGELGDGEDHAHHDHAGDAHDEMTRLHEEAHARADLDVLEGRMGGTGRQELVRAIQAMSVAATLLEDAEMEAALRAEQAALIFLQRAFSRSRYILRAFTQRERLDLDRRLTGSLATAYPLARSLREEAPDSTLLALRSVLAEAAAGGDAGGLARSVLAADPGNPVLQEVAGLYAAAAAGGAEGAARRAEGTALLAGHVRASLRAAPAPEAGALRRLEGVLTDALRRGAPR
jgi:hypothetical protein